MKPIFRATFLTTILISFPLAVAQDEEAAETIPAETSGSLVTANSGGAIKLGMTVAQAQEAMNGATFARSSDTEGIALVTVTVDGKAIMRLSAGEENSDSPLDGKAVIDFIDVMAPGYKTADGVHPGMALEDVEKIYGKATGLVLSELEAREYVTFPEQPSGLIFRPSNKNGSAGIYKAGEMVTTSYRPGSEIGVIEVAGADIMVDGRIGGLGLDAPEADVIALGEKEQLGELAKGEDTIRDAFGEAVQPWTFVGSGFSADMISGEVGGTKNVRSITIEAPSDLKTEHGIGIGSTRDETIRAYANYKTEQEEAKRLAKDGGQYLVGSIHGGMIFEFDNGKVSRIFLGASAE